MKKKCLHAQNIPVYIHIPSKLFKREFVFHELYNWTHSLITEHSAPLSFLTTFSKRLVLQYVCRSGGIQVFHGSRGVSPSDQKCGLFFCASVTTTAVQNCLLTWTKSLRSFIFLFFLFLIVSTGGSAYTRDGNEARLFKQQDPRLQVNTEGDLDPHHDPFQLDEGSPHGGCGRQVVQKVVSRSAEPLVWLCVGQGWCLQPEGLRLVWSFR